MLAVVICLPFVVGLIAGAANNASYPSCADVDAGRAPLSAEGKCFKSDHWQAELALVLAWGTAVALLGAALASIRLLVTGRHGLMVLQCFASGVGLLVLAFLVTRA